MDITPDRKKKKNESEGHDHRRPRHFYRTSKKSFRESSEADDR